MIFIKTKLEGAFLVDLEQMEDERGFFARTWCRREFSDHRLTPVVAQCNVSFNKKRGTLRGMHFQSAPYEEAKLVRCVTGAIYDVIVDLKPDSSTFLQHLGVVLGGDRRWSMLYIPEGFAHGFLTLEDDTEVFYQMSQFYVPNAARGFRWNDPFFSIEWPGEVTVISERDKTYPDFKLIRMVA